MSSKLIISTTGTSIGTNIRRDIFIQPYSEEKVKKEIENAIKDKDVDVISAETKSLNKIGIDNTTHIAFIHTDTSDGRLCAEVLKKFCEEQWNCSISLNPIKGLQVKDAALFAREGIKNYLKLCIELIEKNQFNYEIIFNPTGGFKGIVPYTTLIGMIFHKPIYYIFENSDALIKLPPIPVNYDEEVMDRCAEKLRQIEDNTYISDEDFWKGIEFREREEFKPLIEEEGSKVTLSSIGMLLWERYKKDFPPHLRRSEKKTEDKKINLREDHGKDILMHWAKRLVNSPYVEEIVNSLPFNPGARNPVKKTTEDGLIEIVLTKTDAGYGMVVKTSGRNKKETEEIAKLLIIRYGF